MKSSIVIPTYNCEDFIEENLSHLVKNIQDVVDIIIVDDGSTDYTVSVVQNFIYKTEGKYIQLIENEHKNPASARNTGWKEVKGDVVIFLDSDCKVTKKWYEEMLAPFKEKNIVAVSGVYLSNQKKLIARYIQQQTGYRQSKTEKYTDNLATYSLAVKKEFLKKVDGFPEDYPSASCEDTEFSYKLRKYGKFVLNRKAKVIHHHEENIIKYFKKQFNHAKYRVLMLKRKNPVGDKYAGVDILVQPFLAFVSLLFPFNNFFLFFFGSILVLQIMELEGSLDEFSFFLFSMIIGTIRAYVWLFGMIFGVLKFYVFKNKRIPSRKENSYLLGE